MHNLEQRDGRASMLYTGDVPWHNLGRKLNKPATAQEAMEVARLDYTVVKKPLKSLINGRQSVEVPNAFATVRTDTNQDLGVVFWTHLLDLVNSFFLWSHYGIRTLRTHLFHNLGVIMKYAIRTVTWRFKESIDLAPEFTGKSSVTIKSPKDVFDHYKSLFTEQVRERFIVFWLSASNKILGFEVITEGLLNSSLSHPREVFRGAIVATSAAIIIAHNHPSANPEPSGEDIAITKQIAEAGKIIGIPVHDHIIFAGDTYTSMCERGYL